MTPKVGNLAVDDEQAAALLEALQLAQQEEGIDVLNANNGHDVPLKPAPPKGVCVLRVPGARACA